MTSSLVGSEMCIRDSLVPWREMFSQHRLELLSRTLRTCLVRDASPLKAVSYTHLTLPTICSV
eukprot:9554512-Prorocentrum_lima.AAC.1